MAEGTVYRSPSKRLTYTKEDLNAPLPPLPRASTDVAADEAGGYGPFDDRTWGMPIDDKMAISSSGPNLYPNSGHQDYDPFADDAAIPLQEQYCKHSPERSYYAQFPQEDRQCPEIPSELPPRPRKSQIRRFLRRDAPWTTYFLTTIQIAVFIAECGKNWQLTGTPIEIHPSFNPMIGPSAYLLINMGGRYVPCMRAETGVQDSDLPIAWPCPNQTDTTSTCSLSELCGFSGVPNPVVDGSVETKPAPNQWFRFITPIFLHAGIVHIGFNMLLQILLGSEVERSIGHIRFITVYFASGIFGFVMGGNFAPSGIVSTGASGSLFGLIALLFLDLLYTWPTRPNPRRDLLFILLDVIVSFALGLFPGLDNFSHIGGFLMGLVLGVFVLRSPAALRREREKENEEILREEEMEDERKRRSVKAYPSTNTLGGQVSPYLYTSEDGWTAQKVPNITARPLANRTLDAPLPPLPSAATSPVGKRGPDWYAFTLLRLVALAAAVTCLVVLLRTFYSHHSTECEWCKYLSCLPIKNWCDVGELTFTDTYGNGTSARVRL